MPHAQIQAVSYAGERSDVNYQTDARNLVGPLDSQVMEALHFVDRNVLVNAAKRVCDKWVQVGWSRLSIRLTMAMCTQASLLSVRSS